MPRVDSVAPVLNGWNYCNVACKRKYIVWCLTWRGNLPWKKLMLLGRGYHAYFNREKFTVFHFFFGGWGGGGTQRDYMYVCYWGCFFGSRLRWMRSHFNSSSILECFTLTSSSRNRNAVILYGLLNALHRGTSPRLTTTFPYSEFTRHPLCLHDSDQRNCN